MSIIQDGKGSGQKVGVSDNRLDVTSRSESRIYYLSRENGQAFSVYGRRNHTGTGNENILSLTYTGNKALYIKEIIFSSNSPDAKIELYFDATSVSGGTEIIPLNLNRSSAISSETTCLNGVTDLTGTTTTANEVFDVRLSNSSFLMDFHGAIILPKNKSIFVLGSVQTAGEKTRIMVYYYEE